MKRKWQLLISLIILCLVLSILFLSCNFSPRTQAIELDGAVFILLDTVRADHLSCYGYSRETSPNLSQLAKEGVLFEQTVSYSPWTLPSVANIFSSKQLTQDIFNQRLNQSVVESITKAGYATAAFTEGGYVSRHFGFDLGFSEYSEGKGKVHIQSSNSIDNEHAGGIEKTFQMAQKWLSDNRHKKFFLFIHTYEPHIPYTRRTFTKGLDPGKIKPNFFDEQLPLIRQGKMALSKPELQYLEALYDGGILESDRHVGSFMAFLEKIGLRDSTLVVVTSDHGEEFGEHYPANSADHGHSHHDNQLMVPLIIYNPCKTYPALKIPHQVRLMDVMPTVAELLNVPIEYTTNGKSLLPLMKREENTGRTAYGAVVKAGPKRSFLRHLGYKYIIVTGPEIKSNYAPPKPPPPPYQLYDLQTDPSEQVNIALAEQDITMQMQKILFNIFTNSEEDTFTIPDVLDDKLRDRLKSLGYLP